MIDNDANTNKQFRVYDETGHYARLSVDEAIAQNLNVWKDWKCSAGVRGLYIDFDGNLWMCNTASSHFNRFNYDGWYAYRDSTRPAVEDTAWRKGLHQLGMNYRATKYAYVKILPNTEEAKQQNTGFLGNIYGGYDLPKEWVSCPWQSCGCGADVILSKAKTDAYKELLTVTNKSWKGKEDTLKDIVQSVKNPVAVEMNFPIPYQVLWDIGRRCNYDCSYCWRGVHNRDGDHLKFGTMIDTTNRIISEWSNGEQIRWNFGGGEPTLHPRFLDLLQHLKSKNQWVMVTTNGTRDHKYWSKAIEYINSVNLSAHFDGLLGDKEESKFIKNIEVICDHFSKHNDDHWLEIKIMAPPQYIDRALNLRDKIKALGVMDKHGANNRINGSLSLVPIRSLGDSGTLVEYTNEQLDIFKHQ